MKRFSTPLFQFCFAALIFVFPLFSNATVTGLSPNDTAVVRAILDSNDLDSVSALEINTIVENGRIVYLALIDRKLTSIPHQIGRLDSLQQLDLSGNRITDLPDSLARLPRLSYLDLSRNHLDFFPAPLRLCRALQSLRLSHNRIRKIDESFEKLSALECLDIRDNVLDNFNVTDPAGLTRLTELRLDGNCLSKLPDGFKNFASLHILTLDRNYFYMFPAVIGTMRNLTYLSMANNSSMDWNNNIFFCDQLVTLLLDSCNIRMIPSTIRDCKALENLSLAHNRLDFVPGELLQCGKLVSVNLASNQLRELPLAMARWSELRTLDVSVNRLTDLPSEITKFDSLKIRVEENCLYNPSPSVAAWLDAVSAGWREKQRMQISKAQRDAVLAFARDCGISEHKIDSTRLYILDRKVCLDLSRLRLTSVAPSIESLSFIAQLQLGNNLLTQLPEQITKLTQLRILTVDNNQLSSLPDSIGKLRSLREFYCDVNKITALPFSILLLDSLRIFGVRFNRLQNSSDEIAAFIRRFDAAAFENQHDPTGPDNSKGGCGSGSILSLIPPLVIPVRSWIRRRRRWLL